MSCVMCHVSHVTCNLLRANCTYRMSLVPTATFTDPPISNSPTMHSRLVCKDTKKIVYFCCAIFALFWDENFKLSDHYAVFSKEYYCNQYFWLRTSIMLRNMHGKCHFFSRKKQYNFWKNRAILMSFDIWNFAYFPIFFMTKMYLYFF